MNYMEATDLRCCYKLLEILFENRNCPAIDAVIPVPQAAFSRSCTDQVLLLTTHVGAEFGRGLITSVSFIDLIAAYDTVWREGVISKLHKVTPYLKMWHLINNLLTDYSKSMLTILITILGS